jgi:hypothetical protein
LSQLRYRKHTRLPLLPHMRKISAIEVNFKNRKFGLTTFIGKFSEYKKSYILVVSPFLLKL